MRVGLSLWLDQPLGGLVELGQRAEDGGFTDLWFPDHYFLRDVYVAQAMVATATKRIGLGTGVLGLPLRHPALVASSAATIDELAPGRAIIGIGAGGHEFAGQLDLKLASPMEGLRDAVTIIRQLLSGPADHSGGTYTARRANLGRPVGDVPVVFAARGPKMIELAGELADGVIVHGLGPAYLSYVRERVAAGAARAGRDPNACDVILQLDVDVDDDKSAAMERLRAESVLMAGGAYADSMIPLYGLDADHVATLRQALAEGDPTPARFVTDQMIEAFSIGGPVTEVVDKLRQVRDAGVDRVVFRAGGGPFDEVAKRMQKMAPVAEEVTAWPSAN